MAVTGLAAARPAVPLALGARDQLSRARQVGWDHDWSPDRLGARQRQAGLGSAALV